LTSSLDWVYADRNERASMAGLAPTDGNQLETLVGSLARQVVLMAAQVNRYSEYAAATDFTAAPLSISVQDQALLKSAIAAMQTAFSGMDQTFLIEVAGLY
jgi:hypothetical protein